MSIPDTQAPLSPTVLPPTPIDTPSPRSGDPRVELEDAGHLSPLSSPVVPAAPESPATPVSPRSQPPAGVEQTQDGPKPANPNPFNFQPMLAAKSIPAAKPSQRRGHKYKHSSISHSIFLPPTPRAPLRLPASLPIPSLRETISSLSSPQRTRLSWCSLHLLLALSSHYSTPSLALTALSHLLLFDAMSALLCVSVDVYANFDVWAQSSIRHPFGLERAEVLAGFAMSVLLLFMGFDVISHGAEHALGEIFEDGHGGHGGHAGHSEHTEELEGEALRATLWALAAGIITIISAVGLNNRSRVGRAVRFGGVRWNPSHVLTLGCSGLLVLTSFLGGEWRGVVDRLLAVGMAVAMIGIGVGLVKSLGSMLLMSFDGEGVGRVVGEVNGVKGVREVREARFWQVNHGLGVATLKVGCGRGEEERVRGEVVGLVERGLRREGLRWEVSVEAVGV